MLIVMQNTATALQIEAVCERIRSLGLEAHQMPGAQRTAICITGNNGSVAERHFLDLPGILEVIRVSKPYKLTSIETKSTPTVVSIGATKIGQGHFAVLAGPSSIGDLNALPGIAHDLRNMGVKILATSVYLPQHNPYFAKKSLDNGAATFAEIRANDMAVACEIVDIHDLDILGAHVDAFIVESYNMQNFPLLKELGRGERPVILKRGVASSVEEWLMAAEYILSGGNHQVILCEAGIKTFAQHSAYTLDLAVIPVLQKLTHLPIIVDPSQAAGHAHLVPALLRAAAAAGAHGLRIDCHNEPRLAPHGSQAITLTQLSTELAGLK